MKVSAGRGGASKAEREGGGRGRERERERDSERGEKKQDHTTFFGLSGAIFLLSLTISISIHFVPVLWGGRWTGLLVLIFFSVSWSLDFIPSPLVLSWTSFRGPLFQKSLVVDIS